MPHYSNGSIVLQDLSMCVVCVCVSVCVLCGVCVCERERESSEEVLSNADIK